MLGPCHTRRFTGNLFQAISKKKRHSQFNDHIFFLGIIDIVYKITPVLPKWSCSMHYSWLPPSCLQKLPRVTWPLVSQNKRKPTQFWGIFLWIIISYFKNIVPTIFIPKQMLCKPNSPNRRQSIPLKIEWKHIKITKARLQTPWVLLHIETQKESKFTSQGVKITLISNNAKTTTFCVILTPQDVSFVSFFGIYMWQHPWC